MRPRDLYLLVVIALIKLADMGAGLGLKRLFGAGLGSAAYLLSPKKRRLTEDGLAHAFGTEMPASVRRQVARQSFLAFWNEAMAPPPARPGEGRLKRVEVVGLARLHEALQAGRGAILCESNGFGFRAFAKQLLFARGIAVQAVHGANHMWGFSRVGVTHFERRVFQRFFEDYERQYAAGIVYVPLSDSLSFTRRLLDVLNNNGVVSIAGDGQIGQRDFTLDFLGRPRRFMSGPVSLSRLSGAPLLPMFGVEEPAGQAKLIIEAPLQLEAGLSREQTAAAGMRQFARLLESYVRRYPGEYRHWHSVGGV